MNGNFSRGSLWFNLVTGGQTRHTNSVGMKMPGKWDYSLALPSKGEQGNSPSPAPAPQRGLVALREAWGAHLVEEEPSRTCLAAQTLLKCWPTMIWGELVQILPCFHCWPPSLNLSLLISLSQTELFGCWGHQPCWQLSARLGGKREVL